LGLETIKDLIPLRTIFIDSDCGPPLDPLQNSLSILWLSLAVLL